MSTQSRRQIGHNTPQHQRLIRLIHVAKRDLMLDDDTYRAALAAVTGKTSAADMTVSELDKVLAHLKRKGFKVRAKKNTRPLADYPEATKIRALWLFLSDIGAVKNRSENALAAYAKRITGVDDLHWASARNVETLIETLKKWALRFLPGAVQGLAERVNAEVKLNDATAGMLNETLNTAFQRMTFDPMWQAYDALQAVLQRGGANT
jgi:phage gp16-like protein